MVPTTHGSPAPPTCPVRRRPRRFVGGDTTSESEVGDGARRGTLDRPVVFQGIPCRRVDTSENQTDVPVQSISDTWWFRLTPALGGGWVVGPFPGVLAQVAEVCPETRTQTSSQPHRTAHTSGGGEVDGGGCSGRPQEGVKLGPSGPVG